MNPIHNKLYRPICNLKVLSETNYRTQTLLFDCSIDCPVDYFLTSLSISSLSFSSVCLKCSAIIENCSKCLGYPNTNPLKIFCLKCQPKYFPKIDSAKNFEQSCKLCDESCLECVETPTNCVKCESTNDLKFDKESDEVGIINNLYRLFIYKISVKYFYLYL